MPISYKDAGVDIDAANRLVDRIRPMARSLRIPEMLGDLGGFAGLCAVPSGMREPVMVSSTDGVGTKLEVAQATGIHDSIGVDLVAMSVNDLLTTGARPLFFLDYFSTSKLDEAVSGKVLEGIAEGCRRAGCALLGGETSEMPGMYREGSYDLAGFAVGIVERSELIDGKNCEPGDVVLGLASSGLHANGFSLARMVVGKATKDGYATLAEGFDRELGKVLLEPTRIYAKAMGALREGLGPRRLHAVAHITGGGIVENLPRSLPEHLSARIDLKQMARPKIFDWIAQNGPVEEGEMRRTFNLGVGMCVVVARADVHQAMRLLQQAGEEVQELGELLDHRTRANDEARVQFV